VPRRPTARCRDTRIKVLTPAPFAGSVWRVVAAALTPHTRATVQLTVQRRLGHRWSRVCPAGPGTVLVKEISAGQNCYFWATVVA
jgi:hypothetical protein